MNQFHRHAALLICLLWATCSFGADKITSLYTKLGSGCQVLPQQEDAGDSSSQKCAGVARYHLLLEYGDARESITVVNPAQQQYPLNFWRTVSSGFSSVGAKAQWRVKRINGAIVPVALIVRVDAHEDPAAPEKITSYRVVVKLTDAAICITDKIGPVPKADALARAAADQAATKSCIKADE